MEKAKTILITGSSGFIGKALVKHFAMLGWNVYALQRKALEMNHSNVHHIPYRLDEPINEKVFEGADVVVHAAVQHYSKSNPNSDAVNIKATKNILVCCEKHKSKLIFLSTLSAHDTALSHYGKNKFEIEQLIPTDKHVILSLGLVIGHGGLFGTISQLIEKSNFIPMLGANKPIQTVGLDDVRLGIEKACNASIKGKYFLAESDTHTLNNLYTEIAKAKNKKPTFVPLPLFAIHWIAKLSEQIGIQLPIGSESVLGLKRMRAFDNTSDMKRLGLQPKSMIESITYFSNNEG